MAILTINLFNQYSDNYFLSNSTPNNILNSGVRKVLPNIINNVETSLNAMLNGRLYQTFNPNGQITFKDTTQETTLYSVLTECVLYRIQTGEYINLHNQYTGNVNGTNNFSTDNSNVIGLRNDIRDKLILLGLYQSGSFTQATLPTIPDNSNNNILTKGMLFKIVQALQNANINFNGIVSMVPSKVQLGQYGTLNEIYESLEEIGQILSNYTSASGNGTTIPTLQSQMINTSYYQNFLITIEFNTSGIILQNTNIYGYNMNATVSTNGSQTTLTITFDATENTEPSGLYLEPQAISAGWLTGTSSCLLQPSGTGLKNEWNVATSYPTWNYNFSWTNIMNVSFSFVITNATSGTTYVLFLQGYTVISATSKFFISNND